MKTKRRFIGAAITSASLLATAATLSPAIAKSTVVVGATETISSHNPHGDSISMGYGIWCQVYGCLGTYSFKEGTYVGMLAESWSVDKADPNVWTFKLRQGIKRHVDGKELTAEDVVHSINRMGTDPQTRQKQNVKHVKSASVIDKYTVKVVTKKPTAPLLEFLFDRVMITGKDLFDKHGAKVADRKYPLGWGPYKLKEIVIGQRIVLEKAPDSSFAKPENPDTLIFRIMREPEQRVTALLNNEIQIAQFIPPHLGSRVSSATSADLVPTSSVELMFLAMSPKKPPFDNAMARKAACMAINRDAIIKAILGGQAERLDAPIGEGQYAYNPKDAAKMKVPYDPAGAKALLEKAGLVGAEIELETPVGRYVNDKQVTESMIPMLNAVGFKASLKTPEWPTLWANVQKGNVPFFYMGRGGVVDPSPAFAQYFETGGSPRIGFSSATVDALLQKERATFDPEERKKVINQAFAQIVKEQPACFMWKHKLLYGISKSVAYSPNPTGKIWGSDMAVK
ncbi:MAG: ABC transporter substrate-binding protein [Rhodospirillaceae bacterium TMED63]|nr:MAG: ABC transporter substrate-binding protein [Rhodospirillaceae bacterium TMED63]